MDGFYWLIPRVLAGAGRPGRHGRSDEISVDLGWIRGQGIGAILSLTETPLDPIALEPHGFHVAHLPVVDMTAPTPRQLMTALAFIDRHRAADQPVLVHCLVGQGRTGTVLAAYLIRSGLSPERAIEEVRIACPRAVENDLQIAALETFAARREWLI